MHRSKLGAAAVAVLLMLTVSPTWAQDHGSLRPIVIDTDVGIDDAIALAQHLHRVVVAGDPDDPEDFNLGFDPAATAVVQAAGVPLVYVTSGGGIDKPTSWTGSPRTLLRGTSAGDRFLAALLADPGTREHYLHRLKLWDELATLYVLEQHSIDDAGYWQGVRELGLHIWETWHRRELFTIVSSS